MLFASIVLLISITFKDAYSYFAQGNIDLSIYSLIDAGFVLGIATILSYGSSKMKKRLIKKHLLSKVWKITIFASYAFSIFVFLYASFAKGIFFFIDFTEYATALFMLITLSLLIPSLIEIKHRITFSLLVSIPLICDLYIRFYCFYTGISGNYWFLLRSLSFSIRSVSVITILIVLFVYLHKRGIKRVLSYAKERHLLSSAILGLSIAILLIFTIFSNFFNYTNLTKNERRVYIENSLQELNTFSTLVSISFRSIAEKLIDLSTLPPVERLDNVDEVRNILKNAMETSPSYVKSMSRVDKHGILKVTYPFTSVEGTDISYQPHIKKIIEDHMPVISAPIMSVQGFMSLIIHYPVFENGEFNGSIAALISIKALADYLRWNVKTERGRLLLVNNDGIVFFSQEKKYINTGISDILNTRKIGLKALFKPGIHKLKDTNNKSVLVISRKIITTWLFGRTVKDFDGEPIYAIDIIPYSYITASIYSIILPQSLIIILLLIVTITIYLAHHVYTVSYDMNLKNEVRRQTETLESTNEEIVAMNEELESSYLRVTYLTDKLQAILEMILESEVKQDIHRFLQHLLDRTIEIIDDAQKGSIMLKEDDYFTFVAAYGFDINILRKVKIKEEDMYEYKGVEKIPYIANASRVRFPSYAWDKIEGVGEQIKMTLAAPIKIGSEYAGVIFIDNLESDTAFKGEDEQLLEAISRLISLLLSYKKAFYDLADQYERREVLMELIREGLLKQKREEILDVAYEKIKEVYGDKFSVISWVTDIDPEKGTYTVFSRMADGGMREMSLTTENGIVGKAIRERRTIFVNDVSKDPDFIELTPGSRAEGIVHIKYNEKIYTVAVLELKHPFSMEDRQFFEEFGYILSLLIRNFELISSIRETYLQTMIALSRAIEIKDPYTRGHSERVARYAMEIGRALGMKEEDIENIRYAGLLHDIGKIGVAGRILNKNGKLTEEEYAEVKKHPVLSEEIIKDIEYLKKVRRIIRHHHERYDGRGYPDGLEGEEIPIESRILAIADAFDAMTSTRPYRGAMSVEKAISILKSGAGIQWDPKIMDKAIEAISKTYPMFIKSNGCG